MSISLKFLIFCLINQKEIKYFNSIQGWRIELTENKSDINEDLPPLDNLSPFEPATETNDEDLDDLPF